MTGKRGLPPKRRMRHDRHFVDELTQRMGEGIGRMVAVSSIVSNQDQPRTSLGDLGELVASIATHGVLEPLLIRRRQDGSSYELVSGERRFHAALEAGLEEVPCIELTVNDQQALEIALVENLQRKDLSAFEEAEGFRTLSEKYEYTHEQIAKAVGRSRVTVTETLKILAIPVEIRELCRHADINAKGTLLEIAKAPSPEAMLALVDAIASGNVDRAALRNQRHNLANPEEQGSNAGDRPSRPRPFVLRFKSDDRPVSVSLSFRTEQEPEPREIIAALEALLRELRERHQDPAGQ